MSVNRYCANVPFPLNSWETDQPGDLGPTLELFKPLYLLSYAARSSLITINETTRPEGASDHAKIEQFVVSLSASKELRME